MPLVNGGGQPLVFTPGQGPSGFSSTANFDQNKTTFAGMSQAQVQTYFTQLQTAYINLTMGKNPVTVSYEGKSVTYTQADATRLKNLLDEAMMILGYGRQRRALRPLFR